MAIFEIYITPHLSINDSNSQFVSNQSLKFIKDEKNIWALIFPLLWLLWNNLWFWSIIYLVISTIIYVLVSSTLPIEATIFVSIISIIPGLFLILEGSTLVASKLERDGWKFAGVIEAYDREMAEYKFFTSREEGSKQVSIDSSAEPIISNVKIPNLKNSKTLSKEDHPSIGIFSES